MKKIIILLAVAVVCCTACRYEEGPGISFVAPEYRIVGNWIVEKVFLNGDQISEPESIANKPGNYYLFYDDGIMQVNTLNEGTIRYSYYGYWRFQNNSKEVVIDFNLMNQKYYYVATIKKLTKKEMFYEYDDTRGNHWRLELTCISRTT